MRCLRWLLLIVLAFARRGSCFIVRNFASHQPRVQLNCCNVRVFRDSNLCISSGRGCTCPLRALAHEAALSLRGRQVLRRGRVGSSRSSTSGSSTPELDAPGAVAATDPSSAVTTAANLADGSAISEDLGLFYGMELALDALGASTQWVVAGAVGVALVSRADVDTLVFVVGSLFNAVFSKVLKKTINQVRPDGAQLSDPGMPSSHAMSLFYLGTYLVLGLQEHGVLALDPYLPPWPLGVPETQAFLGVYALLASLWRVKAGFHTLPQVSVGAAVGAVDAVCWYHFCQVYFSVQVEAFFGGSDIPVGLAVGVCVMTFLTFGNAQRRISKILSREKNR